MVYLGIEIGRRKCGCAKERIQRCRRQRYEVYEKLGGRENLQDRRARRFVFGRVFCGPKIKYSINDWNGLMTSISNALGLLHRRWR